MYRSKYAFFSYTGIALAILETVLVGIFNMRGVFLIAIVALLLAFVMNIQNPLFEKVVKSTPVVLWAVWVTYSILNWTFGGRYNMDMADPVYVVRRQLLPILTMVFAYYEGARNQDRTILFVLILFAVYVSVGLIFQDRMTDQDSREDTILGNNLALDACALSFFAFLAYSKSLIKSPVFIGLVVLSVMGIFFLSTRKALGGFVIITLFYFVTRFNVLNLKNVLIIAIAGVLSYYAFSYVMSNTMMGERLLSIKDTSAVYVNSDNLFIRFLGDRALFYITGWDIFLEHPVFGIGITNYKVYSGIDIPIHSEYIVELCENGIIGSILYICFNCSILMPIFSRLKSTGINRELVATCLGGMACILFISFTAWTFAFPRYFIMYGIILSICRPLTKYQ